MPRAAGGDAPWSLRLASWIWGLAGIVFACGPALAMLLLWLQYRSLRTQAFRSADIAEFLIPSESFDLAPIIAEAKRIEGGVFSTASWWLFLVLGLSLLAAAAIVAAYLVVCKYTVLGTNTARVFGTFLSAVSSLAVLMIWQTFAVISWLPIDALWANHLGLVVIGLHLAGAVLVWLPSSNAFVSRSALRGSTHIRA